MPSNSSIVMLLLRLSLRLILLCLVLLLLACFIGQRTPTSMIAFTLSVQKPAFPPTAQLTVMDFNHSLMAVLGPDIAIRPAVAWSPDGSRLAYPSGDNIAVFNFDSGEKQTFPLNGFNGWMNWSSDGHQIAMTSPSGPQAKITILNVQDGHTQEIPTETQTSAYWLLGQQQIIYAQITVENGASKGEIRIIDAEGNLLRRFAPHGLVIAPEMSLSPDGRQIAMSAAKAQVLGGLAATTITQSIDVMDVQDGHLTQLTTGSPRADLSPAWSPDGQLIAYLSEFELVVMNADGSNPRSLASGYYAQGQPVWSPDGKHILFEGSDAPIFGNSGLYLIDADGQNLRLLVPNAQDAVWQP